MADRVTFRVGVGRRIRARREELGLSLLDLSDRSLVSKGHLSQVENGIRGLTLSTAHKIVKPLGMTLDDLVKGLL